MSRGKVFAFTFYVLTAFLLELPRHVEARTSKQARVLTFNAAMLHRTPEYETRKQFTGPAIRDLDADIVCLQEVWYEDDVRNITDSMYPGQYPYVISALHDDDGTLIQTPTSYAPCKNGAFLLNALPCVGFKCSSYLNDEIALLQCALDECDIANTIDQQCIACIGVSGLNFLKDCVQTTGRKMNLPGLVFLSKVKPKSSSLTYFEPEDVKVSVRRGFIEAEVKGLGMIACTHMTSDQAIPYWEEYLDYGNYSAQNFDEATKIVTALKSKKRALLVGDINTGPEIPEDNIVAELTDTFNYLRENRFSPTHELTGNKCTYCMTNPVAAQFGGDNIIDVVMKKKVKVLSAKVVLDENLPGETFPLSDHYGVEATVKAKKKLTFEDAK